MGWLNRVLVPAAHVLSVPVYFGYEGVIRTVNVGRPRRPLPDRAVELLEPIFSARDVDFDEVRLVSPALIPSAQKGSRGLTLGSTVFIKPPFDPDEVDHMSLLMHELVHVEQARRHGRTGMAHQYGVGWAETTSYREHPMEREAFDFQRAHHLQLAAAMESD